MAKEVIKESPAEEAIITSDVLVNVERNVSVDNVVRERDTTWSEVRVPIEEEKIEMMPIKDEDGLMTTDAVEPIDIDTTDKRHQRAITNQRNTYAAKKTVAQGMMDVALITANANQLRYLIEYQRNSSTFYVNVILIVCSLLLQIAVGISLIFKGRFDMRGESKSLSARRINNYVVVGVFLTTIINVFVAAFSISSPELPSIPSTLIPGNNSLEIY